MLIETLLDQILSLKKEVAKGVAEALSVTHQNDSILDDHGEGR